jgi:carbon-monoxide dehydrogenase medium subunit
MGAYLRPSRLEDALTALARPYVVLAGGTDFYPARVGRAIDEDVLDIGGIAVLRGISGDAAGWRLGATTTWSELLETDLPPLFDALKQAAREVGGRQIQNAGTLAGNLCNASPAADTIPALIVHEAACTIAGPNGTREVPVEKFCVAPGKTVLAKGEFLLSLHMLSPRQRSGAHYPRFIPRNEMDIAVVGVGASVTLDESRQRCLAARVALAAVAPTPLLVSEAGDALVDEPLSDKQIDRAAKVAQAAARPISDMRGDADYRRHLVGVLTKRVLQGAIARAKEN